MTMLILENWDEWEGNYQEDWNENGDKGIMFYDE